MQADAERAAARPDAVLADLDLLLEACAAIRLPDGRRSAGAFSP